MISKVIRTAVFIILQIIHKRAKIKADQLLFLSDVRDELAGNLKFVYDAADGSKWDRIVFCKDKQKHPQSVSDVAAISRLLNTSKIILLEDVMPYLEFYEPKPGQEIIQIWHAAGAYKKFGFSRSEEGLRVSKGHKKYTWATTSSEGINACYAEAYGIPEDRVVAAGVPRTDIFFDEEWKADIRQQFLREHPQAEGRKVILFAPTYRGTKIGEAGYDMTKLPFDVLRKELSKDYVFVTKWHPAMYYNMAESVGIREDDFLIDMSDVRDVNDILPAADILITDYSSVIFEWSLLGKPIIYYVHDKDEYEDGRGLYFPFDEYVYGSTAMDVGALIRSIRSAEVDEDKRQRFIARFMASCDGSSTSRIIKMVEGEL